MSDQPAKAATAFRQAIKVDPSRLDATHELVTMLLEQNHVVEAAGALDAAFRQRSDNSRHWTWLGHLYADALKQKSSLSQHVPATIVQQCYEKARASAANDPDILLSLADAYADNGNHAKAAETYEQVLALQPSIINVREKLALNWIRSDQKDKAVKVLEDVIRREPLRYEIYNYLGELYEDLDQDDRAAGELPAIAGRPREPARALPAPCGDRLEAEEIR